MLNSNQKEAKTSVVIYDLDGTLIPFNSFKYWVVISFLLSFFFFQIRYFVFIIQLSIKRGCGNLDRIQFKEAIVRYHDTNRDSFFFAWYNQQFASLLAKRTKISLLKSEEASTFYLATAAPDCYVKYYVERMGCFQHYTACSIENGIFFENLGEQKLLKLKQNLSQELFDASLYTDHYDDILLAKAVKNVYLVHPNKKTLATFQKAMISFNVLI